MSTEIRPRRLAAAAPGHRRQRLLATLLTLLTSGTAGAVAVDAAPSGLMPRAIAAASILACILASAALASLLSPESRPR